MLGITAIVEISKLAIEVFKEAFGLVKEQREAGVFSPTHLVELRSSLEKLRNEVQALQGEVSAGGATPKTWNRFRDELHSLSERVLAINLAAVDIYAPALAGRLAEAYGMDSILFGYFEGYAKPRRSFRRASRHLEDSLAVTQLIQRNDHLAAAVRSSETATEDVAADRSMMTTALNELAALLAESSNALSVFLKENWTPKDLSN